MYHFMGTPCLNKYWIEESEFVKQLALLERLSVQYYIFDKQIEKANNPVCLITFDDGHKSNLLAAQLLIEKGLKGVFYVVKDFSINNPDYLSVDDIKAISDMGHLIGVHGKDHEWWTSKDDLTLIAELKETKNWIEDITGKDVVTCSAPGGVISSKVIQIIKEQIPELKYIRTSRWGINCINEDILNSICIYKNTSLEQFKKIVTPNKSYYLKMGAFHFVKELLKIPYFWIKR